MAWFLVLGRAGKNAREDNKSRADDGKDDEDADLLPPGEARPLARDRADARLLQAHGGSPPFSTRVTSGEAVPVPGVEPTGL